MKKLLLSLFASLVLISNYSNAEITSFDERFTLLCEIEDSTGFNWSNGNWYQANFKAGQKYIIKKQDDEKSEDADDYDYAKVKNMFCSYGQEAESDNASYITRDGCYMIKEFGEESTAFNSKLCRERWSKDSQGSLKLDKVDCSVWGNPEVRFKPNGLIHVHNLGSLESSPKGVIDNGVTIIPPDYKDSMYIAFGRCSTI
ncbi:hypothetical protein ACMAZA_04820 [Pseudothioglobus sp. nBUS_23]|uniref:hypothetical protein n=1 Tax=Pseudothioglobus sp. nBUS_23 TaxID=3395318 RepID=UPI003EC0EE56